MSEIVDRIFEEMNEKGITQTQLAEKLGIRQSTVAGWKQRDCPPPINYISSISELLDVPIDYLVTGNLNPMQYKLSTDEMFILRHYRIASDKDKELIRSLVLKLTDEDYVFKINPRELLKTL